MAQNHNNSNNNDHQHQHIRRTSIIIVAILILIQGILYLVASAWSFLTYKCRLTASNTQLGKVMHFIYFRDNACGEISWSKSSTPSASILFSAGSVPSLESSSDIYILNNNVMKNHVQPDMPNITTVAFRTYILICGYGIISSLWILTTIMVLSSICSPSAGRKTYHCCFLPWKIVIILGCLLDIIATGFHIYDIYNTRSAEKALQYLDVKNIDEMMNEIKDYSKLFLYPAIIFTCISSRLIVFWLVNIFGVFVASKRARK